MAYLVDGIDDFLEKEDGYEPLETWRMIWGSFIAMVSLRYISSSSSVRRYPCDDETVCLGCAMGSSVDYCRRSSFGKQTAHCRLHSWPGRELRLQDCSHIRQARRICLLLRYMGVFVENMNEVCPSAPVVALIGTAARLKFTRSCLCAKVILHKGRPLPPATPPLTR